MIFKWLKRKKFSPCIGAIPYFLRKNWGVRDYYSIGQVKSSYSKQEISGITLPYSVALYCDKQNFKELSYYKKTQEELIQEIHELYYSDLSLITGRDIINSYDRERGFRGDHFHESGKSDVSWIFSTEDSLKYCVIN